MVKNLIEKYSATNTLAVKGSVSTSKLDAKSRWAKRNEVIQGKINSLVQLKNVVSRLEEFQNLQNNWDGYGADKVSDSTLELANQVAKHLIKIGVQIDFCAPLRNGGVQFEFKLNEECEIEIYPNGDLFFLNYDESAKLVGKEKITLEQLKSHAK